MTDTSFTIISRAMFASLAHRTIELPEPELCADCGEKDAAIGILLYPAREMFPLCSNCLEFHGGRTSPFTVEIQQQPSKIQVPHFPAGDEHSWVGAPKMTSSHLRGVVALRYSYNLGEATIQDVNDNCRLIVFSFTPSEALLMLDVLREAEHDLQAMAKADHQIIKDIHRKQEEAALRADAELGLA